MKTIITLNELLIENLRALYDAEILIQSVLPKIIDEIDSPELKRILFRYYEKVGNKIDRLDKIFILLKQNSVGVENNVIDKIVDSSERLLKNILKKDVRDAAIIAELQRINHLLITDYGTACAFANVLELEKVAKHLHRILSDEKHTDQILSDLAKEKINSRAKEILFA